MRIWRIETKDGGGPYATGCTLASDECQDSYHHPTPASDRRLGLSLERFGADVYNHDCFKYGFFSLEACRAWFYRDKWLENFEERGFYLAEIEIDSKYIAFGDKQLAFLYEKIESKTYLSVKELMNESTIAY
jgi:hypothetical protein